MGCGETMICGNLSANDANSLLFGSQSVCRMADVYGTPLYLMDADRIRENCRLFKSAVAEAFGPDAKVAYASKAVSFRRIYRIMAEEGMWADVVSRGEIATAESAGFPLSDTLFHSCNKTDADIADGVRKGVGYFVADNIEELEALDRISRREGCVQKVLVRLTPGIDPHTFAAVATGNIDSKFGFGIATGLADEAVARTLKMSGIELCGFHCHMGSQMFDAKVLQDASEIMLEFVAKVRKCHGIETKMLDMGGGFAVRYEKGQQSPDIRAQILALAACMKRKCSELGIALPAVCFEPGRSIVADAGLTVYTVGSVKRIPGFKTYVSVDGGMTDNIRFALYGSRYTVVYPKDVTAECGMKCSLVGRCCESGDIIQPDVRLPETIGRGDYVAVLTTGAYNYSMASNYNRIPRPAVVMVEGSRHEVVVRRETEDCLLSLDV